MTKPVHILIMAGGSGTRFWPFSTPQCPKQFLDLTGEGTMLQCTVRRLGELAPKSHIWVLTNKDYVSLVQEQLPELPPQNVVGEPMLRDTAAAIALGAGLIANIHPDALLAVLPADHVIKDSKGFENTIKTALALAESQDAVTIGISPTYPATGFGYLHRGEKLNDNGAYHLKGFVEKPPQSTAQQYLDSKEYYWNAGMFVWSVEKLMTQLENHLPAHALMAKALIATKNADERNKIMLQHFEKLNKISVDFGLMEKLTHLATVEARFDWNDVGGWLALAELIDPDSHGNTLKGAILLRDSHNNILVSDDPKRPVLVCGVKDSVLVCSKNGTLLCSRAEIENIKPLVQELFS